MHKFRRMISLVIIIVLGTFSLIGCNVEYAPISPKEEECPKLRIGVLNEGIKLTLDSKTVTVGDTVSLWGEEYSVGDHKPVWNIASKLLDIEIIEVAADSELTNCDLVIGDISELDALGRRGKLFDISDCFSKLPNLKSDLYSDELIFSFLGGSKYGEAELYVVPTRNQALCPSFSAFLNEDVVRKLLDDDFEGTDALLDTICIEPQFNFDGTTYVDALSESGELIKIQKDHRVSGNILELFRMFGAVGLTGNEALKILRNYVDNAYGDVYGERRSELFLGNGAAYDADELCALLLTAMANKELLSDDGELFGICATKADAMSFFGSLYGVRGVGSANFTYIDSGGVLRDCRTESETYELLRKMNDWVEMGILTITDEEDTTPHNNSCDVTENTDSNTVCYIGRSAPNGCFAEILPPVALWFDGTNISDGEDQGSYFRFSESATRTGNSGIAIVKHSAVISPKRLEVMLKLLDFAFSEKGKALFLCTEMGDDASASDTPGESSADYLYNYYGAGVCFFAPMPERTVENGDADVAKAIELGIVRCAKEPRGAGENWYTEVPKLLPYTAEEYNALSVLPEFSKAPTEHTAGWGILSEKIIKNGLLGAGFTSGDDAITYVRENFRSDEYLALLNEAYNRLIIYYYEYKNGVEY